MDDSGWLYGESTRARIAPLAPAGYWTRSRCVAARFWTKTESFVSCRVEGVVSSVTSRVPNLTASTRRHVWRVDQFTQDLG